MMCFVYFIPEIVYLYHRFVFIGFNFILGIRFFFYKFSLMM